MLSGFERLTRAFDSSSGTGALGTKCSDNELIWSFRLQGDDEWGTPPQEYSEGHLRVVYVSK